MEDVPLCVIRQSTTTVRCQTPVVPTEVSMATVVRNDVSSQWPVHYHPALEEILVNLNLSSFEPLIIQCKNSAHLI